MCRRAAGGAGAAASQAASLSSSWQVRHWAVQGWTTWSYLDKSRGDNAA